MASITISSGVRPVSTSALFDGLSAAGSGCRVRGNPNWEDAGQGFLEDARITVYALWMDRPCGITARGRVTNLSGQS
jgi:hypothetical protein